MYLLSYKIHDWDGGEFEPLFCSQDKVLLEDKQKELTDHYLSIQRRHYEGLEKLCKQFPKVDESTRAAYTEEYNKLPEVSRYYLFDPVRGGGNQCAVGEFVIDEVEEL